MGLVGANPSPLSRYAERDTTRREHLALLSKKPKA